MILKQDKEEILGYLIVISDLTQVTLAQRAAAWKEVAQRVAHEIKNPLTPIQLSAQRLKRKFANKLENKEEFEKTLTQRNKGKPVKIRKDVFIKLQEDIRSVNSDKRFKKMEENYGFYLFHQNKILQKWRQTNMTDSTTCSFF